MSPLRGSNRVGIPLSTIMSPLRGSNRVGNPAFYNHVAPSGLESRGNPAFYNHVAPSGLAAQKPRRGGMIVATTPTTRPLAKKEAAPLECERGCFFSKPTRGRGAKGHQLAATFNTSAMARLKVSLGRAPMAIWGCSFMGTKSSEGMLWMPNIWLRRRWSSVSTL